MSKPEKIVNIHGHLHPGDDVDALVREWEAHGVLRFCCQCIGGPYSAVGEYLAADDLLPWMRKYPGVIVGFADVDLGDPPSQAREIEKRKEQGFAGLKFILPRHPYNDERYYHIYEAAEKLQMPILFHTGYVANPSQGGKGLDIDSLRMSPGCFDRIAREFPDLVLIGAHLGHPFYDLAQMMAANHENVYFDMSGGSGRKPHLSRLKRALAPFPGADWDDPEENLAIGLFEKMLFATDNPPAAVWIAAATEILDYLQVPERVREFFWWKNAARILRLQSL